MGDCEHTERSLPHTAAVTPESLRSCLGRGGIGTPYGGFRAHKLSTPTQRRLYPSPSGPAWTAEGYGRPVGDCGRTERSLPHTAAVTPESLRFCLGRGGIGTPRGGLWAHGEVPPPHSGGYTRVPPVLPRPRRDRGALWGISGTQTDHPHTAAVAPESLRSCLGRRGIGTPRGGLWAHGEVPPPHNGGYTRVPPVLPRPRRDRDAPWGIVGARRGPSPTQRRLHPSPSGPAWAAEG